MTARSIGRLGKPKSSFLQLKDLVLNARRTPPSFLPYAIPSRSLAQLRDETFSQLWFTPSSQPLRSPADELLSNGRGGGSNGKDYKPPDQRTVELGKTLRELSPLLPNILLTAVPLHLLSPSISLHLFPSTHPHLPIVKGRVPYRAALWTAPVAWGSVPIVGNVKLKILSERVVRKGCISGAANCGRDDLVEEQLVVRWKTEGKKANGDHGGGDGSSGASTDVATTAAASPSHAAQSSSGINRGLSTLLGGDAPIFKLSKGEEFAGIFIFGFDKDGLVASHTIEHADEGRGWDRTAKVLSLTDWLLGKARWRSKDEAELMPGLAMRWCKVWRDRERDPRLKER